jgi:hypothetical protein
MYRRPGRPGFCASRRNVLVPGLTRGSTLVWQCPDAVSNVGVSAAIMGGYPEPMHNMPDVLIRDGI